MCCLTYIAGSRLDLVKIDAPDIVDVFVGTPLGTSDHCYANCVLSVEQSVLECNAFAEQYCVFAFANTIEYICLVLTSTSLV